MVRTRIGRAVAAGVALATLLCGAAGAGVVYSQPPSPDGGLIPSSFLTPDGMDGDGYAYDSFVLASSQAITEVQWRGGDRFNGLYGAQPVTDFTLTIYAPGLVDSEPGITVAPLAQYSTGGNAGETPAGTFGGTAMYDYHYVLPTPFQAAAGTKYWVQIEASQTNYPNGWSIAAGTGGNGTHFQQTTGGTGGGGNLFQTLAGDVAFTLLGTGGSTVNITASVSPAGAGTVSGAGPYPLGSNASLTATPNPGFGFADWTENGAQVSTSATYSFTATADRSLVANFVPAYTITTASYPPYGGSTSGGGTYNSGASVTVTATAGLGHVFTGWADAGAPASAASPYTFAADADRSLVAQFALAPDAATFDFDTGFPPLQARMGATPMDQTSRGLTAHFTSPTAGAGGFSVQSDASLQYRMSQFSGNYLWPNSVYSPALDIQFSRPVTGIAFTYATADFHQTETPTTVRVSGYVDSTSTTPVGSASGHGAYLGDTMPMGRLEFTVSSPFSIARIEIPPGGGTGAGFLVDNITVVAASPLVFTLDDAGAALRIWAGFATATGADASRLNVETAGGSAGVIDMADALRIARKAAGLDPNP